MLALRLFTWMVILFNWIILLWLYWLLKRSARLAERASNDANHWAVLAVFTQMKLQEVAPGTTVPVPPDTVAWMEAQALHNMVYGDGG